MKFGMVFGLTFSNTVIVNDSMFYIWANITRCYMLVLNCRSLHAFEIQVLSVCWKRLFVYYVLLLLILIT